MPQVGPLPPLPLQQHSFVGSSNLEYGTYDQNTQTLYIQFQGGAAYAYSGVPPYVWNGLITAPSAGKYFHATIKNGRYSYQRVTPGSWQ